MINAARTPVQSKIEFTAHLIKIIIANKSDYKESVSPVLFLCAYELYKIAHAVGNGDQFFIHRTEIFDFVVR